MKITIKDLRPNPFRNMDSYPIDRAKIKHLKNSINTTGFWDNILARNNVTEMNSKGEIQIAYGHHRLIALQEIFKSDNVVDIPVKNIDDDTMLRIMAEENNDIYPTNVKVINGTIKALFEHLGGFQALTPETTKKGGRPAYVFSHLLYPTKFNTSPLAKQMAGWLGGNWTERTVYDSLEQLRSQGDIRITQNDTGESFLDRNSVEAMPHKEAARTFAKEVKEHKLSKIDQQKLASKLNKIHREKDALKRDDIKIAVTEMLEGIEAKKSAEKKLLETQLKSYTRQILEMRKDFLERTDFVTTLSKTEIKDIIEQSKIKQALSEFDEELN